MMCTENIKCNLVFDPHQSEKKTLDKQKKLLNKYINRISNYNMRNIIQFRNKLYSNNEYYIFNPDSGLNDEQINFLSNPNLDKCMVGFDMDETLHQCGLFINTKTKELIKDFSRITRSKISYNDIGEYYFGGKIRLNKIKTMFQNLERTIGSNNIYIITANQSSLIPIILPELYGKLFGIKLHKKNIKQATSTVTKYDIIKKILGI